MSLIYICSGFEIFEEDVPECIHLRIHVLWNH